MDNYSHRHFKRHRRRDWRIGDELRRPYSRVPLE